MPRSIEDFGRDTDIGIDGNSRTGQVGDKCPILYPVKVSPQSAPGIELVRDTARDRYCWNPKLRAVLLDEGGDAADKSEGLPVIWVVVRQVDLALRRIGHEIASSSTNRQQRHQSFQSVVISAQRNPPNHPRLLLADGKAGGTALRVGATESSPNLRCAKILLAIGLPRGERFIETCDCNTIVAFLLPTRLIAAPQYAGTEKAK